MIATWPSGPHSAHVALTETRLAVQLQQSVLLSASVWTILLCWPSYRGVSETYLILVGALRERDAQQLDNMEKARQ